MKLSAETKAKAIIASSTLRVPESLQKLTGSKHTIRLNKGTAALFNFSITVKQKKHFVRNTVRFGYFTVMNGIRTGY